MIQRILVGVDGSEAARRALSAALELAAPVHATLTLLYAVPPTFVPPTSAGAEPYLLEAERTHGQQVIEQAAAEARGSGVAVEARVVDGYPARVLAEVAEREGFDLVVTGSHGRGALARAMLGSVTDRLAHTCHRPLLIVH